MPIFNKEFLSKRKFRVRVRNVLSAEKTQENGIPQGSVISVTLFLLRIDGILNCIPSEPGYHCSLYIDDLQVAYSLADLNLIQEKLKSTLGKLTK